MTATPLWTRNAAALAFHNNLTARVGPHGFTIAPVFRLACQGTDNNIRRMVAPGTFVARMASGSFERTYRISVQGNDLYFIELPGVSVGAQALTAQLGLAGLLIGHSLKKRAQKKAEAARQTGGQQDPEAAIRENKNNFKLYAPEIKDASIDPPGFWQLHGKQAGRLTFTSRDGKKRKFEFENPDEMKTALEILPRLLNATLRVNAEWDESKKQFQKLKRPY